MGKYDIVFNNKKYAIDESSLSSASDALKSHLSTVMSGSGAVVNLGGISYNVDSTKLSSATTDFINHLGSISGNGYKVVIGGNEYSIASDKVANVVGELGAIWGGLEAGIGDSEGREPIVWDGNMDGRVALDLSILGYRQGLYYVKVSDDVFTPDDVIGWSYEETNYDGVNSRYNISSDMLDTNSYSGGFVINNRIFVLYDSVALATALGIPNGIYTNGVYFLLETEEGYTSKLVGKVGTSWVLVASEKNVTANNARFVIEFTAVAGKNYKLEVIDVLNNTVFASNIASCTTAPMMGMQHYSIGKNEDAVHGDGGVGNTQWTFFTRKTSSSRLQLNIYEER